MPSRRIPYRRINTENTLFKTWVSTRLPHQVWLVEPPNVTLPEWGRDCIYGLNFDLLSRIIPKILDSDVKIILCVLHSALPAWKISNLEVNHQFSDVHCLTFSFPMKRIQRTFSVSCNLNRSLVHRISNFFPIRGRNLIVSPPFPSQVRLQSEIWRLEVGVVGI